MALHLSFSLFLIYFLAELSLFCIVKGLSTLPSSPSSSSPFESSSYPVQTPLSLPTAQGSSNSQFRRLEVLYFFKCGVERDTGYYLVLYRDCALLPSECLLPLLEVVFPLDVTLSDTGCFGDIEYSNVQH
jgi:hypothetical protein